MNDAPVQPEQRFGVVEIKNPCTVPDCGEPAVAGQPLRTPSSTGVLWLCDEHARAAAGVSRGFRGRGGYAGSRPRAIVRTCGAGADSPCGAAATYMAILGVIDEHGVPELALASLCRRHAGV